jgi:hypothetical protein
VERELAESKKDRRLTLRELLEECMEDDGFEPETLRMTKRVLVEVQNLEQRRKDADSGRRVGKDPRAVH